MDVETDKQTKVLTSAISTFPYSM